MSSSQPLANSLKPSGRIEGLQGSPRSSTLVKNSPKPSSGSPKKSVKFQLLDPEQLARFYKRQHTNNSSYTRLNTQLEVTAKLISDLALYELCTGSDHFNSSNFPNTFSAQILKYCETLQTEITPKLQEKANAIDQSGINEVKALLNADAVILKKAQELLRTDSDNLAYQQFWQYAQEELPEGLKQFHTEVSKKTELKLMIVEFVKLILQKTIPFFSHQTDTSELEFNRFLNICGRYVSKITFFRWMSLERVESIGTYAPQLKTLKVTDVLFLIPNNAIPISIINHSICLSPFTELEVLKLSDVIPTKEFLKTIAVYLKKLRRLSISHKTLREIKNLQIGGLSNAHNLTSVDLKGSIAVLKKEWEELIAPIPDEPTSVKAAPNFCSLRVEENLQIEDEDLCGLKPRASELKYLAFHLCPKIKGIFFNGLHFNSLTKLKIVCCPKITLEIVRIAGEIDTLRKLILECSARFTPHSFQDLRPAKSLEELTIYYSQLISEKALDAILELPQLVRLTLPTQALNFENDKIAASFWNHFRSRAVQLTLNFIEYEGPAPVKEEEIKEEEEVNSEECILFPELSKSDSSSSEAEDSSFSESTPRSDQSITPRSNSEVEEIPIDL